MLLSDRDIRVEIDKGRVVLDRCDPEMVQPSSVDIRLDRYFRVIENHRYSHIDPALDEPDLTRAVEPDGEEPFGFRRQQDSNVADPSWTRTSSGQRSDPA